MRRLAESSIDKRSEYAERFVSYGVLPLLSMTTPQQIHSKKLEAERQAKDALVKLAHAKDLEKQASEAEVRMKQEEMRKAQEDLRKQQRELAKIRSQT